MSALPDAPFCVLKVGGSVLTDRERIRTVNADALRQTAAALAGWLPRAPGPVVLVVGGGSFGHNVVAEHGLSLDGRHAQPAEAFELTASLFALKAAVARALADQGVRVMPLQETLLFGWGKEGARLTRPSVLSRCRAGGWLPLVTGGLVPRRGGVLQVMSSDRVARAVAGAFPVRRYVVLTDRPGLCDPFRAGFPLVRRVSAERHAEAMTLVRPATRLDVNGAMREKLLSVLELAARGVESVIGDGRELDAGTLATCFGDDPPGTCVEAAPTTAVSAPTPRSFAPIPPG
jgi:isopentenyl phosphate kinase